DDAAQSSRRRPVWWFRNFLHSRREPAEGISKPNHTGFICLLEYIPFGSTHSPRVIAGLDPAIHDDVSRKQCSQGCPWGCSSWMRGSSPRMTVERSRFQPMETASRLPDRA